MRAIALIALLSLAAGCSQELGEPDVVRGALAVSWSVAENPATASPEPPAPTPGGECLNCNGKGQVGDGRTMLTCPVCNGSGRLAGEASPRSESPPAAVELLPPEPKPTVALPPTGLLTDPAEACNLARESGRLVVMIDSPAWFGCGPCRELAVALAEWQRENPARPWIGCYRKVSESVATRDESIARARGMVLGNFPRVHLLDPSAPADPKTGVIKPKPLWAASIDGGLEQLLPEMEKHE